MIRLQPVERRLATSQPRRAAVARHRLQQRPAAVGPRLGIDEWHHPVRRHQRQRLARAPARLRVAQAHVTQLVDRAPSPRPCSPCPRQTRRSRTGCPCPPAPASPRPSAARPAPPSSCGRPGARSAARPPRSPAQPVSPALSPPRGTPPPRSPARSAPRWPRPCSPRSSSRCCPQASPRPDRTRPARQAKKQALHDTTTSGLRRPCLRSRPAPQIRRENRSPAALSVPRPDAARGSSATPRPRPRARPRPPRPSAPPGSPSRTSRRRSSAR